MPSFKVKATVVVEFEMENGDYIKYERVVERPYRAREGRIGDLSSSVVHDAATEARKAVYETFPPVD